MRIRAAALMLVLAAAAGCASGAGPDGATDRACKELAAAAASQEQPLAAAAQHGLDTLTPDQTDQLAGYSDQLRVIAGDAADGALAATLAGLDGAADDWDRAWNAGDVPGLLSVSAVVATDLDACRTSGVAVKTT